jgi:hypothetical protein
MIITLARAANNQNKNEIKNDQNKNCRRNYPVVSLHL